MSNVDGSVVTSRTQAEGRTEFDDPASCPTPYNPICVTDGGLTARALDRRIAQPDGSVDAGVRKSLISVQPSPDYS